MALRPTKQIRTYTDGVEYVNRLGLNVRPGTPGWIPVSQTRLCANVDRLIKASGQTTIGGFEPFRVRYLRNKNEFLVERPDGKLVTVEGL